MVKHTQPIRRQIADKLFNVFDYFVELALKGLRTRTLEYCDVVQNLVCVITILCVLLFITR